MSKPEFVYVTYIETTPEKLWDALTNSDFTERYWFGYRATSDWKAGSPYHIAKDGQRSVEGMVLVSDRPNKLVYAWDVVKYADRERTSRVTFDIEPRGTVVQLTVTHDELDERGRTLRDISGGWPMVLASLKSFLETGKPLPADLPSRAA
ncbi:SRPBCC family protein [Bradyrhizobium sp. NP1]|uniref:SRPBCC family protein n=1 Tax=Bradyrhizobium sp. NP1 TaxID=3049772 RepID=UPI0025A57685|nr:SRPBCC family protein [Bradyrhizobium sp. NP1]WJR77476.1 SRPBCC family protein [Bradyrhizobium sp. NP1]